MKRFEWERLAMKQPFNGDALRVLWCYASHADAETGVTHPSIRTVATETDVSVERVGKFRSALLSTGWLVETSIPTGHGRNMLQLGVGKNIERGTYLGGAGRKTNDRSARNLVPAAKQEKQKANEQFMEDKMTNVKGTESLENPDRVESAGVDQSLENPDRACLEYREAPCLEYRENQGSKSLDNPDVTTNEQYIRTTNYNHTPDGEAPSPGGPVASEAPSKNKLREKPTLGSGYFFNSGELKDLDWAIRYYSLNQEDLNLLAKTLQTQVVKGSSFRNKIKEVLGMMNYDTDEY